MCVLKGDHKVAVASLERGGKISHPDEDDVLPSLVPASDSSSESDEGSRSTRWMNRAVTKAKSTLPSAKTRAAPPVATRAACHAVTHARTTAPKPPLPIKAARVAMSCAHPTRPCSHEVVPEAPAPLKKLPSSMKLSSRSRSEERHVTFGDLEMRNYSIVLGDHPDCSSGPPVAIGWDYITAEKVSVDKYEEMKPRRRSMDQLELNYFVRKRLLRRTCVSDNEMRSAIDEVHRIQKQRMRTKRMQPVLKVEEGIITFASKLGNLLPRRGSEDEKQISR